MLGARLGSRCTVWGDVRGCFHGTELGPKERKEVSKRAARANRGSGTRAFPFLGLLGLGTPGGISPCAGCFCTENQSGGPSPRHCSDRPPFAPSPSPRRPEDPPNPCSSSHYWLGQQRCSMMWEAAHGQGRWGLLAARANQVLPQAWGEGQAPNIRGANLESLKLSN